MTELAALAHGLYPPGVALRRLPEALEEILPTLAAGMIPKMGACLQAVQNGVPRATVVDGREPHAVLLELFTNEGVGTQVLPGVETKTRKARAAQ